MASLDDYRKQELMKRSGVEMYSNGPFAAAKQPKSPTAAAPAGPGLIQRAFPNAMGAISDRRSQIDMARQTGGVGAAFGQSARTALNPLIGFIDDSAGMVRQAVDPAAQALKTFATGDATPIGQSPLVSAAAKAPTPRPVASYSNEGRTAPTPGAMPSQAQAQAPSNPLVNQIAPGIYRQGNSFSDTAEGAASGARPAPISGQNMAAADQLAARYATQNPLVQAAQPQQPQQPQGGAYIPQDTGGFGLLDKGYQQRRSAMMDVQQLKPGSGKALAALLQQQTDAPKFDLERDRMAQAGEESAADRLMRGQELSARMGESAADRALKSQELADNMKTNDVTRQAAGVELTAAQRMAALQGEYLNAETDAARDAAAKKINALSGKGAPQDEYMAVGGGETVVDPATGLVVKNPDMLVNKRTGQPVQGQAQKQAVTAQRPVGAISKVGDKTAVWDGTKWVPQ